MEKNFFTSSKEMSKEYCCTIVSLGEVHPVPDSDYLGVVLVEGDEVIVRRDLVHKGDIMLYAQNETEVNTDFLRANNLFEKKELNSDPEKKGYFNKSGRVRMITLRGQYSKGYLFTTEELLRWKPNISVDLRKYIGTDFDTIDGELFIKAYMPRNLVNKVKPKEKDDSHSADKFSRIIPGEFMSHYETAQLQRNIHKLKPTDNVAISVQMHGASAIFANVRVRKPLFNGFYSRIFEKLPFFLRFTKKEYDLVYSSRRVVKNRDLNSNQKKEYYGSDIWGMYAKLLKDYIPEGYSVYGEIVGYTNGNEVPIQTDYDYGCKSGESKLIIYRVNYVERCKHREMNVYEVLDFTRDLMSKVNHLPQTRESKCCIMPLPVLYYGQASNIFPRLSTKQHWQENLLTMLRTDTNKFNIEGDEPLCAYHKVPREGIVLRIDDDPINEAFKLKSNNFLNIEEKLIDRGVVDSEMLEGYSEV